MGGAASSASSVREAVASASESEKVEALRALRDLDGAAFDRLVAQAKEDTAATPKETETKETSRFEEAVLAEHNVARTDPIAYANSRVVPLLKKYDGKELNDGDRIILTREGATAAEELLDALRRHTPCEPVTLESGLCAAARRHAADLATSKDIGHKGSDGSEVQDRIEQHGEWWGLVAENVSLGWKRARDVVLHLLIDDGVEARGHRANVLDPRVACLGVSELAHLDKGGDCVVLNYTGGFGPPKKVLRTPLKAQAKTAVTEDVKAILDSLPRGLDQLKADILGLLLPGNDDTQVVLDYKPNSLQVKFITSTSTGTTTKTQNASWAVQPAAT